MSNLPHIAICRENQYAPHIYRRLDWHPDNAGSGYWSLAVGLPSSLRALVEGLMQCQIIGDLTISTRAIDSVFETGAPDKIRVMDGNSAHIIMPIMRRRADNDALMSGPEATHWTDVICLGSSGFVTPRKDRVFVERLVPERLRELLNDTAISRFNQIHTRSGDVWIRRGMSGANLFPNIWPAFVEPVQTDPADLRTEQQKLAAIRKAKLRRGEREVTAKAAKAK